VLDEIKPCEETHGVDADIVSLTTIPIDFVHEFQIEYGKAKGRNGANAVYQAYSTQVQQNIIRLQDWLLHHETMKIAGFECYIHTEGNMVGYVCRKATDAKLVICKVIQAELTLQPCAQALTITQALEKRGFSSQGVYIAGMTTGQDFGAVGDLPMGKQVVCQPRSDDATKLKCDVKKISTCLGKTDKCNKASSALLYF
jgi:hypothetical protein